MKLLCTIVVPGRLPSWNDMLGMEHWQRYKFKNDLAKSFLSALRQSETDCSMRTISQRNSMSIYADTLASYLTTARARRALRSAKKRLNQERLRK